MAGVNWRKVRMRDVLNPKKWLIVLESYWLKGKGVSLDRCHRALEIEMGSGETAADFWSRRVMGISLRHAKIIADRASKCPTCVANGNCEDCGCPVPENMYSLRNECSAGNWGAEK